MTWSEDYFGTRPEHVILAEAEEASVERAKDVLRGKIELATSDHTGKRLNERRWRWLRDMVESL